MTPYFRSDTVTIYNSDALEAMSEMPDNSVAIAAVLEGFKCIGVELNIESCRDAVNRLRDKAPLFATAGQGDGEED